MAKHIVHGKVCTCDYQIFKVKGTARSEQEIQVHFSRPVPYRVVKLSIKDLPRRDKKGQPIRWINNFGIIDHQGRYVKEVSYTVFLRPLRGRNRVFIYRDRSGLRTDKTPRSKGSKPSMPGWVQVNFNTGDPAVGSTGGG